jgi:hypothetical protein
MERRRAIAAWSGALAAVCLTVVAITQHVPWLLIPAIVLAVLAMVILVAAGIPDLAAWVRDRAGRPTPEQQSPIPPALRTLARDGRAMRARLPPRDRRGIGALSADLTNRFAAWKGEVSAALEPWPDCLAQFQGAARDYWRRSCERWAKMTVTSSRARAQVCLLRDQPCRRPPRSTTTPC